MNAHLDPPQIPSATADIPKRRWRPSHSVLAFGLIGVTLGTMFLMHSGVLHSKVQPKGAVESAQSVTVAPVAMSAFRTVLSIAGEARPRNDVRVYAPAQGVRIVQLLADEGDVVRAGQALARLDTNLATAQTSAAAAQVAEAQAAATRSTAAAERADALKDSGALSLEAIEARRADAQAAQARLRAARAQLAEVNARLQGGYVRAPAGGVVLSRTAQLGAPVDGQPLFRIAGGGDLEVAVEVGEADMLAMKQGQLALFRLVDGTEVQGRLRRGAASIDSRTRTGSVVFDLPRDRAIRPGMFVRGEAALPPQSLLSVPQTAVVYDKGEAYVFVVDAQNKAQRMKVRLGARSDDRVAVMEGLQAGQSVVAGGAAFLRTGDAVRPVQANAPAQPVAGAAGLRGR